MKIAVELGSVADGSVENTIKYCQDLSVDRLTVPLATVEGFEETGRLDLATVQEMKQKIDDAGMSFDVMVDWTPEELVLGEGDADKLFDDLCHNLEVMHEVDADILATFIMVAPGDTPAETEERWGKLIGFYEKLMPRCEDAQVRLAEHTVANRPRNIIWDYAAMKRLIDAVPSPCNGVNYCTGNFWNSDGEDMYDQIRELGEKVFYVHVRDTMRHLGEEPFWFDEGGIDFARLMLALRDINYQGDIRSEHMPEVYGENRTDIGTAWAMGYVKALMQFI